MSLKNRIHKTISDSGSIEQASNENRDVLAQGLSVNSYRIGVLTEFLDDEDVITVLVNGTKNIYIQKNSKFIKSDICVKSKQELLSIIDNLLWASSSQQNDKDKKIFDFILNSGHLINIVLPPLTTEDAVITIKKVRNNVLHLEQLVNISYLSNEIADFLKLLLKNKANILISGKSKSGKNTFLNSLVAELKNDDRIIAVENKKKIALLQENSVKLTCSKNAKDITLQELVKNVSKMFADVVILSDITGEEIKDLLALGKENHCEILTTIKANSVSDTILKIETMFLKSDKTQLSEDIKKNILSSIDFIINLGTVDNEYKIVSVSELSKLQNTEIIVNDIFQYDSEKGYISTGFVPELIKNKNIIFATEIFDEKYIHSQNRTKKLKVKKNTTKKSLAERLKSDK